MKVPFDIPPEDPEFPPALGKSGGPQSPPPPPPPPPIATISTLVDFPDAVKVSEPGVVKV